MCDPNAAIDRWQSWGEPFSARPRVVQQLGGGRTNQSFLLAAGARRYVLRLNSPLDEVLGIDRSREQRILADAAAAGIAPCVRYHSLADGILVSDFVDGTPLDARDVTQRDALIAATHGIHALATCVQVDDYYAHAARYRNRLDAAGIGLPRSLEALGERILDERANGLPGPQRAQICHRDLIPANVIASRGRLYIIDWEYATRGDPAFDFAAICVEWNWVPEDLCRVAGIELPVLEHAIGLYRYTCELWHLVNAQAARL